MGREDRPVEGRPDIWRGEEEAEVVLEEEIAGTGRTWELFW